MLAKSEVFGGEVGSRIYAEDGEVFIAAVAEGLGEGDAEGFAGEVEGLKVIGCLSGMVTQIVARRCKLGSSLCTGYGISESEKV